MRSIGIKALGLVAAAAIHSHAIFGLGGHWAPAPGLTVDADGGVITPDNAPAGTPEVSLDQGVVEGLNGFGFKLWVDFLPFIDIEAGTNFQFGYYKLDVVAGGERVPVEAELDVPFVEGKPVFARILTDVSVLYPFLKFPPAISLLKFYAGGGITHVLATEVVNASFAEQALRAAVKDGGAGAIDTPEDVAEVLADAIIDEGLTSGVGFHLMAGVKAKPPIIPLAVYGNLKYHLIGSQPDAVDANSLTFELGGALAF